MQKTAASATTEKIFVMSSYLSWSRPTPQTRMLLIGWEWSKLRSSGSTRFNIRSWSTNSIPLPCETTHNDTLKLLGWELIEIDLYFFQICDVFIPLYVMAFKAKSWQCHNWPLPRPRLSHGCPSCSKTAVWYSDGQPYCSSPHTGPALPSPPNPESALEMTER